MDAKDPVFWPFGKRVFLSCFRVRIKDHRGKTMDVSLSREEVIQEVDRAVDELLASAGVSEPPVDAIRIAQDCLGIVVCLDSRQPQRGRAHRAGGKQHIFLRPEPSEERHQWTVAHEIGEFLKGDLLRRCHIEPEQTPVMMGESLANLFADHLLLPTRWFLADSRELRFDLFALKRRYRTASHEVIAWRWLDCPEPCVVSIIDNDRVWRRRSNAWPVRSRRLEPAELECQRQVHMTKQNQMVSQDGWTVQGWPIYQAEWKREILRSVRDIE
ncbi:MAG: hypothetical protein KatS3mg105_2945 [Gemmatales bacterium]|nr:MAG: hypothetical protein KatS3mg105_2945 [Gemmatales bacterium]